jgi:signal transduction histidine kinase/HAMP domain-containing protein
MPSTFWPNLRASLLWLILLAILPLVGVALYTHVEQRRLAIARVQDETLRLARLAASNQEGLTEGARQLLIVLAHVPPVRERAIAVCNMLLTQLLPHYPHYTAIGVVDADGNAWCRAPQSPQPRSAAGRTWFQRVMQTGEFAIGDYQIGGVSGKPIMVFGYPVFDDADRVQDVVYAALDLAWLNQPAVDLQLPPGAGYMVLDRRGTILARYPDVERWVGQSLPEAPLIQTILTRQGEGTTETVGLDGVPHVFAFTPVHTTTPSAESYVTIGASRAVIFASANRVLIRQLLWLGLVTVMAFAAAWLGADRFILKRVRALVNAAQRLGAGDLSARTGLPYGSGELDRLARVFDDMAAALEQRTARLTLLNALDRAILTAQSSRAIAQTALEHLQALVSCWRTGISLFDVAAGQGIVFASTGGGQPRFPTGTRLALENYGLQDIEALQAGRIYIVEDVHALAVPPATVRSLQAEGLRSYARLPLRSQGELIGALNLWADKPGGFTPEQLDSAHEVADVLAVAIQHARLHEQVQHYAAELEQRVAERTAQLEAANKELEAFSYSVSHDLRAPLRSIDGFSQALLEDYAESLDAQGQDFLRRIRNATQRMGELIDALLILARVTRADLQREVSDLSDMARAVVAELRRQEPTRQVEWVIADGLKVSGDARLLRVVLENLLSNAWKFSAKQPAARIEFGALEPTGGLLTCFVRDNGAGFDMAYADKLFGAFQRLHRGDEFPGTGVGLATVQRVIHRHGGRIWAEASVGQGATFYFTLGDS